MTILKNTMIAALGTSIVLGSIGTSFAKDDKGAHRGMPSFEKVDANADGKIDFSEFQLPMIERFDEVDANKDGTITATEAEASADGRREERMIKRIVMRFDIDKNSEVTKAELENRQQKMFAMIDLNDDGFLTEDEMPKRGEGKRGDKKDGKRGKDRS